MAEKDEWNARAPRGRQAATRSTSTAPSWPELLPVLYPGVFPNLAAYDQAAGRPARDPAHRHPDGRRPGVPELHRADARPTCCGSTSRSRRRRSPNELGLVAGDAAGFPNGRRVDRRRGRRSSCGRSPGLTIPLVDPSFTPDGAAAARRGRHVEHQRRLRPTPSPTSGCPAVATRPSPAPPRPRDGAGRLPTRTRRWRTRTPGRGWCCSTSAVTSAPWWSRCRTRWSASRSRSGPTGTSTRSEAVATTTTTTTTTGTAGARAPPARGGRPATGGRRQRRVAGLPRGHRRSLPPRGEALRRAGADGRGPWRRGDHRIVAGQPARPRRRVRTTVGPGFLPEADVPGPTVPPRLCASR